MRTLSPGTGIGKYRDRQQGQGSGDNRESRQERNTGAACRNRDQQNTGTDSRTGDQETTERAGREGKSENVYNCIQKLIDILLWSGIIRKRKAKALEATAQSVSSGAFFILYCIMSLIS